MCKKRLVDCQYPPTLLFNHAGRAWLHITIAAALHIHNSSFFVAVGSFPGSCIKLLLQVACCLWQILWQVYACPILDEPLVCHTFLFFRVFNITPTWSNVYRSSVGLIASAHNWSNLQLVTITIRLQFFG